MTSTTANVTSMGMDGVPVAQQHTWPLHLVQCGPGPSPFAAFAEALTPLPEHESSRGTVLSRLGLSSCSIHVTSGTAFRMDSPFNDVNSGVVRSFAHGQGHRGPPPRVLSVPSSGGPDLALDKTSCSADGIGHHHLFQSYSQVEGRAQLVSTGSATGPSTVVENPSVSAEIDKACLLYTSPSSRDGLLSRMPSSA